MKVVIGLLFLLTVASLSACSNEPTPVPAAPTPTETPVPAVDTNIFDGPEPTATPAPTATPEPTPTSEPAFSLDVTRDTTWAQVIGAFAPQERDCIRNAIDRRTLARLSRLKLVWPGDDDLADEWTPAIFACLDPDTASALFASVLLAFLEPGFAEAGITVTEDHKLCAQEQMAGVDVAAVLVTQDEEAGMKAYGRIINCFPQYRVASFVGMMEMGVYLDDEELACVREWSEGVEWETVWEPAGEAAMMGILPGLADCSPDLVLNLVLQESGTGAMFWDLSNRELDCLRDGMAALDWASIPAEDGMGELADAVNVSRCVTQRFAAAQEAPKTNPADDDESLLWHFPTEAPVTSAPTVADGVLYFGSEDHHVYALDAETGDMIWRFETGDAVRPTPTVAGDAVYVASDDEHVYALDRETGKLLWQHNVGDWVYYEFPLPASGDVIVYMLSGPYEEREVQARDGATGDLLWAAEMPGTKLSPAVIGGKTYVSGGMFGGKTHALDASTGEVLWTLDIEGVNYPPVVIGGVIYLTDYDAAYAVDEATGEILWTYPSELPTGTAAVVEDGVFYFAPQGHLYALDAATGRILWSYPLNEPMPRPPVVAGGMVFLGSIPLADAEFGQLRALDAASGEVVWSQEPTGGYVWSLSVVDGVLYAEDSDGSLRAIDPATGEDVWEFQRGSRFDGSSYAVADGVVYVGSTGYGSGVYAFTAPLVGLEWDRMGTVVGQQKRSDATTRLGTK